MFFFYFLVIMLEVLTSVVITILKIPNMSVPNMYGLLDIVYIQIMCSFSGCFPFGWIFFFSFFFCLDKAPYESQVLHLHNVKYIQCM